MELTTGAILRQITHTRLSASAHKLATIILDGIAWKDGYNGLPRGTAAFALKELATRMEVSRQYLHILLAELADSGLRLIRRRGRGQIAPWLFRFACCDEPSGTREMSTTGDNSPYIEDSNKNAFYGTIVVDWSSADAADRWLALIGKAKQALPCAGTENGHIWDRFKEFNRRRGHSAVPAGYLLGFMRKWRAAGCEPPASPIVSAAPPITQQQRKLQQLIAKAPVTNRNFHESDLKRAVGIREYVSRLEEIRVEYGCSEFQARLALHGAAIITGEISP